MRKDRSEPTGSTGTKQFLNITDPAFENTEHKTAKNECFFSPEILSPPYIQLIRLRERFKKIWRRKKKLQCNGKKE